MTTPKIDIVNNVVSAVITPSEGHPVTVSINQPVATISSVGIQGANGGIAVADVDDFDPGDLSALFESA